MNKSHEETVLPSNVNVNQVTAIEFEDDFGPDISEKRSYITVIAPGTLHSARKYNVAVAVHYATQPCQLKVGITSTDTNAYNEIKTIDLKVNEMKIVKFDVPKLVEGKYNLTAEGVAGIIFNQTARLNWRIFRAHTKVQTDKGAYKPGDCLNFRVLFLDENLRPYYAEADTSIWLEDAKRNRIKEFKDFAIVNGVYNDKFQISEFPVLGSWRLAVKNGNGYPSYAYFEVSKYVLPKYEVKVQATENVSVRDGDMQVTVKASYTYGKPVDGKVLLTIEMPSNYERNKEGEYVEKPVPALIKTTEMTDGKAKFDLNLKKYAAHMPDKTSSQYLGVTATVEEKFADVKISGTAHTELHAYRYEMYSLSPSYYFDPNTETEVECQVKYVDGTAVNDTKSVVKLIYKEVVRGEYWRDADDPTPKRKLPKIDNKIFTFKSHLNERGIVVFKVTLPELEEFNFFSHYFEVDMAYADEERHILSTYQKPKEVDRPNEVVEPRDLTVDVAYPNDDNYSFQINEPAVVTVNSSTPLSYLMYNIIGRGNILHSERVEVAENDKELTFTIIPTFYMSPCANLFVYYVDESGQFHYAECNFHTKVVLQNQLEISAPEEVKPGTDVPISIKTAPNSFVGLLAVDQSTLLNSDNNQIAANFFHQILGSFGTRTTLRRGFTYYPGTDCGIVTLTNAGYFYEKIEPDLTEKRGGSRSRSRSNGSCYYEHNAGGAILFSAMRNVTKIKTMEETVEAVPVRKDFSETWIFDNIKNTKAEQITWSKKIPDTITSWVLSGFSLHPEKGLGITDENTKVRTFQPFFISIRLPYAVKRGEVISVSALVFNYLEKDLNVTVTLDNSDKEFDFVDVSNVDNLGLNEPKRSKTVRIPANSAAGVSFMLRPKVIGNIMLKYTAISPIAGDAIHKTLKVVPEGVTEYANRAYLVNLKDVAEFKETFELALPSEVVPDSEHIEFTVIGDLLAPILNNLENLVRMPAGCGEQVISALVPNYLVWRYLKGINKLSSALEIKMKHNLEEGYQRILSYRVDDGSFSSFGPPSDKSKPYEGSTWLTAYVVRSLQQTKQYINIDEEVLKKALAYLASRQASNGSFEESEDFWHAAYRKPVTLAAKVLLAFIENEACAELYKTNIDKALTYILENIDKTDDLHIQTLAAYVLHKANHSSAAEQQKKLKALAKTDDDRMWWSQRDNKKLIHCCWWRWSVSNDVEITSYMLLMLLDQGDKSVESVLPIMKWLIAQRNSCGGFSSTQDTVVGLQALIKFAEKSGYKAAVMDIEYTSNGDNEKQDTVKVNDENGLLLQSVELPQKTHAVDFHAKGTGAALVQISYQYNILEKEKKPSFSISTVVSKKMPPFKLEMKVSVAYIGEDKASNMALVEISLPSGFVADVESFKDILAVEGVRQTETKNSDSDIVVYFESLAKNEVKHLPIVALKSFAVALQKPVPIIVYDYYDTSLKATTYYEVISKMSEICEEDNK